MGAHSNDASRRAYSTLMNAFAICCAATLLSTAYQIDFTRIFASPQAEVADRAALERDIEALQAMRGHVAADVVGALRRVDAIQAKAARHSMYLYLRAAVDTRDEASRQADDALSAEVEAKTAFVRDEIMRVPDERRLKLGTWRYAVDEIRRWRPHTLSEPEEKLLATTAPSALNWQFDLWEKAKDNRDLAAFALMRLARARNDYARLRHFHDAAEWSYFERHLTRAEVKRMLDRVAANAGLYKRYQQLRAARPRPATPPQFTIDEARQLLLEATAPLGAEYTAQLRALLDPANGRMDILPGPNRKRGGFSEGASGVDSVFYSGGFTGTYNDVRVLAHESAHAVQRQLMNASGVPMAYRHGANYVSESLAIVCELLLADFMAKRTGDVFYLEQFLDGKGMVAFVAGAEAELEEAVYDGTIRGPDDVDALTARIGMPKEKWMSIPLMYEDPFYDVNYVYGALIGLRIYARLGRDPQAFVAMMKNGDNAPPAVLLKRYFDIELDAPIDDVVQMLSARVDAY